MLDYRTSQRGDEEDEEEEEEKCGGEITGSCASGFLHCLS